MGLENLIGAGIFINSLDSANPVGTTDSLAEADNHLRGIKNAVKNSFPNITGALTASQVELNIFSGAGVTALGSGGGLDADTVDGFEAVAVATPDALLALDINGDLPASITGNAPTATLADDSTLFEAQAGAYYLDRANHTGAERGAITAGANIVDGGSFNEVAYGGPTNTYGTALQVGKALIPTTYAAGFIRIYYTMTTTGSASQFFWGINDSFEASSAGIVEGQTLDTFVDLAVNPGDIVDIRVGSIKNGVLTPQPSGQVAFGIGNDSTSFVILDKGW